MLMVPPALATQGWQVRTIGDDIAWIHVDESGQLRAINPEAGFFGVVPGTNTATNSAAMATMNQDTIFTNVALADDGIPWWEGKGNPSTLMLTDWLGNRRRLGDGGDPLAHPNSRFTAPARNCPTMSSEWESPDGVPLAGILFGGRRADTVPLIRQARDWQQGVFFGATMASQKTAAAEGKVGELRFDPMAMLPFCGYHMGDYFAHWLRVGQAAKNPPAIFAVNWFQKDADNNFLWPGYGENVRALIWAVERIRGAGKATETPIGSVPTVDALHTEGLALPPGALEQLLVVSPDKWRAEATAIEAYFATFGDRLPDPLQEELARLKASLG
jgi:phosphoenolpyruvate carboxykinase (GTP)